MGIAVVTGANRGIGLELARQLSARGTKVVAACRNSSPELDALGARGVRVEAGIDVADPDSRAQLATRLEHDDIDLLIHNAGVLRADSLDDVDLDGVQEQIEINAIAPLFLTRALVPRLSAGAKVALITSRMGSIGDNGSGGYFGYRMSKAALNAAGVSLAHDLKPRGVAVVMLHPGPVRTGMTVEQVLRLADWPGMERKQPAGECWYLRYQARGADFDLMIIRGMVVRIELKGASTLRTISGLSVASSEAELAGLYGARLETQPHKYDPDGHTLTLRSSDGSHGLRFETSSDKVTAIQSGPWEHLNYVEGCG